VQATSKLHSGESATFKVETTPYVATNEELTWKSNTSALTINGSQETTAMSGDTVTVTAAANVGKKAKITVKSSNGKSKSYTVTIIPTPTNVKIFSKKANATNQTYTVAVGKTLPLTAKAYAESKATSDKITWSSDNGGVSFTKSGVKVNRPGTYRVTATTYVGTTPISSSCTIVGYTAASKLALNKTKATLKATKEDKRYVILKPTLSPGNVSEIDKDITWTVSKTSIIEIATVDKNSTADAASLSYGSASKTFHANADQAIAIKALKKGTVKLTGKTPSGKKVTATITIK
jgi:hypothetical protein